MKTNVLKTNGVLEQVQTRIVLPSFVGAILPNHVSFSDTVQTNVAVTDSRIPLVDIAEGDNYPVVDMAIQHVSLNANKMGSMLVFSNAMMRKSVEGTINWITANVQRGLTQIIFNKLEAVHSDTATTLSEALAKVNHLSGGIIYSPNADELKDYSALPLGWRLVLAPVLKPLVVPNNSIATIITALELEESTDATINMVSPAVGDSIDMAGTTKVASLFQEDLTGLKYSVLIDIKAIDIVVQIA